MLFRVFIVICFFLVLTPSWASTSKDDFSQYYDFVYQIKVVAKKAGGKSSIGSGFQISESGLVVTNYHVISSYVQFPEKNKITYESHTGEVGNLTLLEFDVVNDIALLQHPKPAQQYFELSSQPLDKGETIFALGNPSDFGIKLVKGPNNGMADHRYDELILFSASLNGGMSGGPALNEAGEVVGVNVSTAGGQLSFLVPVEKVVELINEVSEVEVDDFQLELSKQLKKWQRKRVGELISSDWESEEFADRTLFGQIRSDFKCWGSTNEDDNERKVHRARKRCSTGNVVYLGDKLNTGNISILFKENESIKLNPMQFSEWLNISMSGGSKTNFDNASNYHCNSDFVDHDSRKESEYSLISTCIRHHKKLTGLFDSLMRIDMIGDEKSFTALITMYGVEKDQIQALNRKFIEEVL